MQGIQRGLRILEAVAAHQPVGVGELSRVCELPKSSVQRVLRALADSGWIRAADEEQTRWTLTSRMLTLAGTAAGERGIREAALGPMRELGALTGETVTLQVPDGPCRMVLIERVDCRHPVRTHNRLGATSPITATSTGLAVLALMPDEEVERVLARPVPRLTANTLVEPHLIRARLREARARGFAVNRGQNRDGVCAVGAAVTGPGGVPAGGIGLSLPDSRFDTRRVPWWAQQVRLTAAAVSAALTD
ncbi:IclR family transcriptional regulator [Streptomyces sp. NPDC001985]|uniref:IclR family transcriptional regulator n=1 Tax=Streptomyces sp. NPDC001985 TaxID=3154406 RepID=UPI00332D96D5